MIRKKLTGCLRHLQETGELDGIWEKLTEYGRMLQDTGETDEILAKLIG